MERVIDLVIPWPIQRAANSLIHSFRMHSHAHTHIQDMRSQYTNALQQPTQVIESSFSSVAVTHASKSNLNDKQMERANEIKWETKTKSALVEIAPESWMHTYTCISARSANCTVDAASCTMYELCFKNLFVD